MANEESLRRWFEAVDVYKTGNINATDLKNLSFLTGFFQMGRGFLALNDVYEALMKCGYTLDQPAFYTLCQLQTVEYESSGKFLTVKIGTVVRCRNKLKK